MLEGPVEVGLSNAGTGRAECPADPDDTIWQLGRNNF